MLLRDRLAHQHITRLKSGITIVAYMQIKELGYTVPRGKTERAGNRNYFVYDDFFFDLGCCAPHTSNKIVHIHLLVAVLTLCYVKSKSYEENFRPLTLKYYL